MQEWTRKNISNGMFGRFLLAGQLANGPMNTTVNGIKTSTRDELNNGIKHATKNSVVNGPLHGIDGSDGVYGNYYKSPVQRFKG